MTVGISIKQPGKDLRSFSNPSLSQSISSEPKGLLIDIKKTAISDF